MMGYNKKKKEKKNKTKIKDYYSDNRFKDFLIGTNSYSDIYSSKEALISLVLACIGTVFLWIFVFKSEGDINERLFDLLSIGISSHMGLLGFGIGGLALLVGTIGKKLLETVDDNGKFNSLLGIIFRFYFVGAILAGTTVIHIFSYMFVMLPYDFSCPLVIVMGLLNFYFFFFSLISSVMLMGSCIRLMILEYKVSKET